MLFTPDYFNPRAVASISLSCLPILDVSSILANCTADPSTYTHSLHDALPISSKCWTHALKQNTDAGSPICGKIWTKQNDSTIYSGRPRLRTSYRRLQTISPPRSDSGAGTARLPRAPNERVLRSPNVLSKPSKK